MATLVDAETAPYVLGLPASGEPMATLRRQMAEVSACFDLEPPAMAAAAQRLEFVHRRVEFVLRGGGGGGGADQQLCYPFAAEFAEPVHLVGLKLEVIESRGEVGQVESSIANRWEAYCCENDPEGEIAKTHKLGARMLMPTLPVERVFPCIENERERERAYSAALLEDRAEAGILQLPDDRGVLVPERHGFAAVIRQMYGRPNWISKLRLGCLSPLGGRFLWLRPETWRMLREFAARYDAPPMQLRRLVSGASDDVVCKTAPAPYKASPRPIIFKIRRIRAGCLPQHCASAR